MALREFAIVIPILMLMIVAGLFIGSITGQVVRGETEEFSTPEFAVILVALFIVLEFAIVAIARRKRRPVNISEMVREARKITY